MAKKANKKKKTKKKKNTAKKVKIKNSVNETTAKEKNIEEAVEHYSIPQYDDGDAQYKRIYQILGVSNEDDAQVNMENLQTFLDFLKKEIEMPCIVTGIEDMGCFGWEEFYNFGPGDQKEYKKLKKKYPSFRDEYNLLSFEDNFNDEEGLYVHVQRISDKKKFYLTLADLESVNENEKNAHLLNDHAVWFVNFR